jgi:hypothetical protein
MCYQLKTCTICKQPKELKEFNKNAKRKDGLQTKCRKCSSSSSKKHFVENRDYYRQKKTRNLQLLKDWVNKYKSELKCCKCSEDRWWVLDFHHNNPLEKDIEVSTLIGTGCSKEKIFNEINKCSVLCANCHRDHHYQESLQKLNCSLV